MADLYFGWTEECGWEGETWTLWLPVQGNQEFLDWFAKLADEEMEYSEGNSESLYSIEPEHEPEEFVIKLCNRRSRTSYMSENSMEDKVVDVQAILDRLESEKDKEYPETLDGMLYKMQIKDYLK